MRYITLKDVCTINMGQSPDSKNYNEKGEGMPFFQGNADFGERFPNVKVWCKEPIKTAKPYDILISVRAPIGALNYSKEECCIGRGLAAITPDTGKVCSEFVFWLLQSKNAELNAKGTGSTFKAISKKALEDILIPDIGLQQQYDCARSLEKIYAIIQMRKQEIRKLDDMIKARFVEMFGDPISDSMNWGKSTLFEICDKLTDGTHFSPQSYKTGKFKYITAKNIKRDGFDFTDLTYVNADVHKEIYSRCNPEFEDVLYIKDGVTAGIAIVNTLHEQFTMLSSVALLKYNRRLISGRYLCAALNNDKMYNTIRGNMGGAAITRLTIAKLNKIAIPIPPLELQEKFASFVAQIDKSKFCYAC